MKRQIEEIFLFALIALLKFMELKKLGTGGLSFFFFFKGYENDSVEDLKEMTSVSSRKRGKRRYFWEYSEQLTPSQQERMLRPSEWNRDTLPSNMYQKNGLHHGKRELWSDISCHFK